MNNSRATILAAVVQGQPERLPLPPLGAWSGSDGALPEEFGERVATAGGTVLTVPNLTAVADYLATHIVPHLAPDGLHVTTLPALAAGRTLLELVADGRSLAPVELAVLAGEFGVAENGAVWVHGATLPHRALPFICQHLVLVLPAAALVPTMHEALPRLASPDFDYGVFIAGPSKTADIEQSLVVGAHGPRSLLVFLLTNA